ncbi:MAG: hypothetical protein Q7J27_10415 [Syntrophales bacterium]|nr:hypothetical protein [Syntrophales bacterium]
MPSMPSFSVLHSLVKDIKKSYSLKTPGLAFDRVALELLLKLNEDDIENSLTDGEGDGGIDAIYIQNRDVHIFNMKYTDDFDKTSKNFPGTEIDKLISTLQSLISGNLLRDYVNELVFEKYEEIKSSLYEGPVYFHIHLASNKEYPVDSAKQKLVNSLSQFKFIDFYYHNLEDLVEIILENQTKKIDGHLTLLDRNHFEKLDGNIHTIIGVVAALDLINLIKDKDDESKVNQFILNENGSSLKCMGNPVRSMIEICHQRKEGG